jgi:hypothetical protein
MCTRVKEPTEEDSEKLTRCLRYIDNTKHLGIVLSGRDDVAGVIRVSSYIDVSYGVRKDGRAILERFILLAKDLFLFEQAEDSDQVIH